MRICFLFFLLSPACMHAQMHWQKVDHLYQPLPSGVHVYFTNDSINGKPNRAYYVEADLKNKSLLYSTAVGAGKRYTPFEYYQKEQFPLIVVNSSFFEFAHNSNLNTVINQGKMLAYNLHTLAGKGKDSLTYKHMLGSAIGISKKRKADIAWVYTDSSSMYPLATQEVVNAIKDSIAYLRVNQFKQPVHFTKWKMQTAVGGGPVLIQNGNINITNNEELKFTGRAILDKHPRTAMGYTKNGKLIMMAVEGRFPGRAEGVDLEQLAKLLKDIGCIEALNLDGGGSSCLLINGKQTIQPSDKEGQRPVPAVFLIHFPH